MPQKIINSFNNLGMMQETDGELIQACRQGDAQAWEHLINKYERLVFSIPLNYGLSVEDSAHGLLSNDLTGALIRVNRDGSRDVIASAGLVAPGGLAFAPDDDHAAYVTNFGIFPGEGQVVRIPIEDEE